MLRKAGLSHRMIEEVLRPFLSGVFADRSLDTSSHVFAMVLRSFARGRIGVPAAGMAALPAAIAGPLPYPQLLIGARTLSIGPGIVVTEGGEIHCRAVIVATDPATAATLLPQLPTPDMHGLTTFYFGADQAPIDEPTLLLDGDRREIIANTVGGQQRGARIRTQRPLPDRRVRGRRLGALQRLRGGDPGRAGPHVRRTDRRLGTARGGEHPAGPARRPASRRPACASRSPSATACSWPATTATARPSRARWPAAGAPAGAVLTWLGARVPA